MTTPFCGQLSGEYHLHTKHAVYLLAIKTPKGSINSPIDLILSRSATKSCPTLVKVNPLPHEESPDEIAQTECPVATA
ncbi:hypothetical protein, partial [Aeromonas hydrophila]|uniref:hypothetical protein n=1 Tax=Aeromonas hydrophila TaxID=644 RepID=UPI003F67E1B4